jgi:hypothetical protein
MTSIINTTQQTSNYHNIGSYRMHSKIFIHIRPALNYLWDDAETYAGDYSARLAEKQTYKYSNMFYKNVSDQKKNQIARLGSASIIIVVLSFSFISGILSQLDSDKFATVLFTHPIILLSIYFVLTSYKESSQEPGNKNKAFKYLIVCTLFEIPTIIVTWYSLTNLRLIPLIFISLIGIVLTIFWIILLRSYFFHNT